MSSWAPELFSCSICLDVLKDPATLACGHSYCLLCIQKHWDSRVARAEFECPQCRRRFNPRPVLARSGVLMEALEKLRLSQQDGLVSEESCAGLRDGAGLPSSGLYPTLPSSSPILCPIHQRLPELYCMQDQQSVCEDCSRLTHSTHQVVRPEQQQSRIQEQLKEVNARIQSSIADREKLLQRLPQLTDTHQVSVQQLMQDSQSVFSGVCGLLELSVSQLLQLLQAHQSSWLLLMQTETQRLQQDISRLQRRQQEMQTLSSISEPVDFLTAFSAMSTVDPSERALLEIQTPDSVVSGVRSALDTFRESAEHLTKTCLASVFRVVNEASAATHTCSDEGASVFNVCESTVQSDSGDEEHTAQASAAATPDQQSTPAAAQASADEAAACVCVSNPAPKTREEMLKFRVDLTLDQNSAFQHIRLSEGFRKATLCAERQNYPEHQQRFLYWRQVLCVEPLAGSPYYWEVEWTGQRVTVGVAYAHIDRSSSGDRARLGHNTESWSLYWSGRAFSLWHAGKETPLQGPKAKRIGVYVDQQAGVLAFYRVTHTHTQTNAEEICCVHTEFQRPLLASFRFWSGVGSSISLCALE
ncbi:finTRIM family, member 86 isoform X2 [Danio aesculapii]|uniref:finTRIM family, member 86 isoform X2 n=1 Tax=Danio aesculapii TaxID=1142201 RepID=UPI0024BF4F3A|nr:finTRIM family, member 86 isoform X2 [Danio aesculapii]